MNYKTTTDSATGRKTTYYYDFTDRLMKYVESGEDYYHSVGYEYDTINNLTSLVETINGTAYTTSYTYDDDNRVSSITNGDSTQSVSYDAYGRVSGQVMKHNGISLLTEAFTYRDFVKEIKTTLEDGQETTQTVNYTSGQVEKLNISTNENGFNTVYEYTYDANGNIVSVKEGNKTTSYTYDSAGQLLRENNQAAGKTWVWTYDNAGNILSRMEYAYTTGTLGAVVDTVNYGYNNTNWKDLLTSYGDKSITYDNIGNPLDDGTWTYTWEHGRQLASMTNGDVTIDYQYNSDGIRTKKTVTTSGDHVHSFQSSVVAPTCTENGYTLHSCVCGYIYQDAPVAATGHNFTTTVVGTNCTEVGHTVHSCSCGYSYEEGANGHNFTTLVVEPTETINGFTLHECDCGYSYESDPVASLGSATAASEDAVSDTKVYDYVYNGSSLVYLTITTTEYSESPVVETLYFGNGTVTYNDVVYYYVTNLQGDVIAILDDEGNAVVEYTYDAWGKLLTTTGSMASTLGAANPLTYRGYVYDTESSLYYLQSRYYNANVGRFINADALVSTGQGFFGCNMYTYCVNNPVVCADYCGQAAINCTLSYLCDDAYVRHYGQGTAVSMSIYNQAIYIDAYMTFYGDLPPETLIAGVKEYWEGTYTNGTYTYDVYINIHYGESENGNTISVYAYTDDFRGYCRWNPLTWSSTKESTIVISSDYYEDTPYTWTIAHEFGHSLGVGDYYKMKGRPGFDDNFMSIMNCTDMNASFYDIIKVIDANKYGVRQGWYCVGGL